MWYESVKMVLCITYAGGEEVGSYEKIGRVVRPGRNLFYPKIVEYILNIGRMMDTTKRAITRPITKVKVGSKMEVSFRVDSLVSAS